MDKLTEIMAHKRHEIAPLLRPVFPDELAELNAALPRPPSFLQALKRKDGQLAVIAEIKRRSPSRGWINEALSTVEQAHAYADGGAAAISVLTEPNHFDGSIADLDAVVADSDLPILKKDFHIDPIQLT